MKVEAELPQIGIALVGAQKCGTTTLAELVALHPSICIARNKEAHLFDRHDIQTFGASKDDLSEHFPNYRPGQILFDATPSYLYLPGCIEALVNHSGDVRVLVILRSPADRAVSHFQQERRFGFEVRSFFAALLLEKRLLAVDKEPLARDSPHRHYSYLDRGRYSTQLCRLQNSGLNFHVILLPDLVRDPQKTLNKVFAFLGLSEIPIPHLPHLNPGSHKPNRVHRLIARIFLYSATRSTERLLGLTRGILN
jgi:Sulfotransferase domain